MEVKTPTFSSLWLVAVIVTWTMLHETAESSELKRFTVMPEFDSVLNRTNIDPVEMADPSTNDTIEAEVFSVMDEPIHTNNVEVAKLEIVGQEYLDDQNKCCTRVSRDCEDLFRQGHRRNGVYLIQPDPRESAFQVYCDMNTDSGGWTVVQRRHNGSENFYLPWISYVRGFGNIQGEFFLGLDKIRQLTKEPYSELLVYLEEWSGSKSFAKYSSFGVGDSASKYVLTVTGYSGNAGDSMSAHSGSKFSAYDQDNDVWNGNCAQAFKGAWWYYSCHYSHLNGVYLGTSSNGGYVTSFADGVVWYHLKNSHYYSVKSDVMMVRRT